MTVFIRNLNQTNSRNVTSFSDNFSRASGPLGQSWAQGIIALTPIVAPLSSATFQINQAVDLSQALAVVAALSAGPATIIPSYAVPIPIINNSVWGKTQFVQFTWKDSNMAGNDACGAMVCFRPSENFTAYLLQIALGVPQIKLQRQAPNAANQPGTSLGTLTNLVSNINANAIANGTVVRLSADFSVGGQVTLNVLFNGVSVASFVDNTPLSGGVPGIWAEWAHGAGAAQTVHLGSFSCGIGV